MNADDALADQLAALGGGWSLLEVERSDTVYQMGSSVPSYLGRKVILVHGETGVKVTGTGHRLTGAVDDAIRKIKMIALEVEDAHAS